MKLAAIYARVSSEQQRSARANVRKPRLGIGPDPGNEDQAADAGASALLRERPGAPLVHRLERDAARLDMGGDRIDNGIGPGDRACDRGRVAHVGADDRNITQAVMAHSAARLRPDVADLPAAVSESG